MNDIDKITIKDLKIRNSFDDDSGVLMYSIIDVVDNLKLSTDPRNYWKVLKNRLKKGHNELVTNCNQLKMASNDGKYYLTDVASANTILQIIQIICPNKVSLFSEFFDSFERENLSEEIDESEENKKISTVQNNEGKISVDIYLKDNFILVKGLVAGLRPEDIFISTSCKILTIKGNRIGQKNILNENYLYRELFWGKFSRVVELPFEVDIEKIEATLNHGLLEIKLSILDKDQIKIIKVRNI